MGGGRGTLTKNVCAPDRVWISGLRILSPTLYQLSNPVISNNCLECKFIKHMWPIATKGVWSRWGWYQLQAKKWGTTICLPLDCLTSTFLSFLLEMTVFWQFIIYMYTQNYSSKFKFPYPQNPKSSCQKVTTRISRCSRYHAWWWLSQFLAGRFGILWAW